jgi:hypothetical protein
LRKNVRVGPAKKRGKSGTLQSIYPARFPLEREEKERATTTTVRTRGKAKKREGRKEKERNSNPSCMCRSGIFLVVKQKRQNEI